MLHWLCCFALVLLFFVTIAYDWRTGNGKYTILANGHCNHIDYSTYDTLYFSNYIVGINKFLQIIMFSAYLVYYYKFNVNVCPAQISLQYNQDLVKIAIAISWEPPLVLHMSFSLFQSS